MKINETEQIAPLVIYSEDFTKVADMANSVLEVRSSDEHEYIAASALLERIYDAIEFDETHITFTENEVICLSSFA